MSVVLHWVEIVGLLQYLELSSDPLIGSFESLIVSLLVLRFGEISSDAVYKKDQNQLC
jgi:hypothetical protein